MRVLIINDDQDAINTMASSLEPLGFCIAFSHTAEQGLHLARQLQPDLVLLDILLPDASGFEVCRQIRSFSDAPIILISGVAIQTEDIIRGLELGADEYLLKPIESYLLQAHVLALLRRSSMVTWAEQHPAYVDSHLIIDLGSQMVYVDGQTVSLSPLEYNLLETLVCNRGQTVPTLELIETLWPDCEASEAYGAYVRQYIKRLREMIEPDPAQPQYIITDYGLGYRFAPSSSIYKSYTTS